LGKAEMRDEGGGMRAEGEVALLASLILHPSALIAPAP